MGDIVLCFGTVIVVIVAVAVSVVDAVVVVVTGGKIVVIAFLFFPICIKTKLNEFPDNKIIHVWE